MSNCACWDGHLLLFEGITFEIIVEHLQYGSTHDSRGLTWLYQMDIDL